MPAMNRDQFRQLKLFDNRSVPRNSRYTQRPAPPITPQSTPAATPAPARPAAHQGSLFQASEVRGTPPPPTFNAAQFRISRHALPGMSNAAVASQRVTPAPAPGTSEPEPARPSPWQQPTLTGLGPAQSSQHAPGAAGPSPTHWPAPAQAGEPAPTRPERTVTINRAAYNAAGQRFGPEPRPADPGPASSRTPAAPPRPATAPTNTRPASPSGTSRADRAGLTAGLAVGLGARAFQSVNAVATDPDRSGNPLFKASRGWNKS